jgi:hypothetical protein
VPRTDAGPAVAPASGRRARLLAAAREAAPAVGLYLGLRLVGVVILLLASDRPARRTLLLLGRRFDGVWYEQIAAHGYQGAAPITAHPTDLAFFPLYPGLIAALDPVCPGPPWVAALALSWLAGLAAAWGLYAIGAHLRDARTGVALAALWAVLPHAVVESMAYTEGLFTAFAAWALYAVLRRRWLIAGALTLVAGVSRPTAAALVVTVLAAAGVAAFSRADGWRPWLGGLLAPLGIVGYVGWVGVRLGRWDGYAEAQRVSWGLTFDGGGYTWGTLRGLLARPQALAIYLVAAVLVVAVVLLVLLGAERWPWPLLLYAAIVLLMTVGAAGYFHSKGRLLVPDFPLLLPVAAALAGARPVRAAAALVPLVVLSGWVGGYLCLVWRYSP